MRCGSAFCLNSAVVGCPVCVVGWFGVDAACVTECNITNDLGESVEQYACIAIYSRTRNDYALRCLNTSVVSMASSVIQTISVNRRRTACAAQYAVAGSGGCILICVKRAEVLMAG